MGCLLSDAACDSESSWISDWMWGGEGWKGKACRAGRGTLLCVSVMILDIHIGLDFKCWVCFSELHLDKG